MREILIVSSDFPYPPNHGGRKDVWNRIELLKNLGFNIDLICTVKDKPSPEELQHVKKYVHDLNIIDRDSKILNWMSLEPFQLKSRRQLKKLQILKKYDSVIVEGDYCFAICDNKDLRKKAGKLIYRMHNDEAKYFLQLSLSEKNLFRKIAYLLEAIRFYFVSRYYIKKFDEVWFISKDEQDRFKKILPQSKGIFLPPHVSYNDFRFPNNRNGYNVLFVGSLFMTNNKAAIRWYLNNVHDIVSREINYHLTIAGNSRNEPLTWIYQEINKTLNKENITVIDSPESLDTLYENNTVFINPMLHGAGVKLKTIEAIQKGLAVVSTPVGIEGTGLINNVHVKVSKNPEDFANNVITLLKNPSLRNNLINNAQEYIKREFDSTKKLQQSLLNKLV